MLLDIEIMVEKEDSRGNGEKGAQKETLEDIDLELEGVGEGEEEQNKQNKNEGEFHSIPVNTQQITMIQEMKDGHSLVFFGNQFPPVTARLGKKKLKAKINKNIYKYYGDNQ